MNIKEFNWLLRFIIPINYFGITIWPFGIYFRDVSRISEKDINHERIHFEQQKELIGLFFYILYVIEWMIKLIFYGKKSYYNISFEREAYKNEDGLKYVESRKHYSWIKYILDDK